MIVPRSLPAVRQGIFRDSRNAKSFVQRMIGKTINLPPFDLLSLIQAVLSGKTPVPPASETEGDSPPQYRDRVNAEQPHGGKLVMQYSS